MARKNMLACIDGPRGSAFGRRAAIAGVSLAAASFVACSAGPDHSSSGLGGGNAGGHAAVGGGLGTGGALCNGGSCGGGSVVIPDPKTCAEAEASHTYLGCDFYPTVLDNIVNPIFDFAVVVANTQDTPATVTVEQGGAMVAQATVPANGLQKIYLPWVDALKSPSWMANKPNNGCPTLVKTATVDAKAGAYHLTASVPVAVYQFNAIEYAAKGGPPGKDWTTACKANCFGTVDCFSYTNDASLLLPSTAMTPNYRVAGPPPWTEPMSSGSGGGSSFTFPPYFSVTGTKDGTMVTVKLAPKAAIAGGGGVPSTPGGGTATFGVDAGDVVLVVGTPTTDFSGSLVTASAPIQVLSGIACSYMPHNQPACDHLEETVLPAETLGKHYFVTRPTGPSGVPNGHVVRIYGNVDGTHLTYPGANPGGPATINAGDVVDLGMVNQDFEVSGDHEFIVSTFMLGAGPVSGASEGDPSQSFMVTVEQYRLKYIFLAPDDYDTSYVDIVEPDGAKLTLDGAALGTPPTSISSGYGVARVALGPGNQGAHTLTSDKPVGIQVMGYGTYTSYQYPGGLNLGEIAPPPLH
jgi:hypothetical protein